MKKLLSLLLLPVGLQAATVVTNFPITNTPITTLTATNTVSSSDVFPAVVGGVTRKVPFSAVSNYLDSVNFRSFDAAQFATNSAGKVVIKDSANITNPVFPQNAVTIGVMYADVFSVGGSGNGTNSFIRRLQFGDLTGIDGYGANISAGTITAYASNGTHHSFSSGNDNVIIIRNTNIGFYTAIQGYNISNTFTWALGNGNEGSGYQHSNRVFWSADMNNQDWCPDLWIGHSISNFTYPRLFLHTNGGFSIYPRTLGSPETNFGASTVFHISSNGIVSLGSTNSGSGTGSLSNFTLLNLSNSINTNIPTLTIQTIPSQGTNIAWTLQRGGTNVALITGSGQFMASNYIIGMDGVTSNGYLASPPAGTYDINVQRISAYFRDNTRGAFLASTYEGTAPSGTQRTFYLGDTGSGAQLSFYNGGVLRGNIDMRTNGIVGITTNALVNGYVRLTPNSVSTGPTAAQIGLQGVVFWNSNGVAMVATSDGVTVTNKALTP